MHRYTNPSRWLRQTQLVATTALPCSTCTSSVACHPAVKFWGVFVLHSAPQGYDRWWAARQQFGNLRTGACTLACMARNYLHQAHPALAVSIAYWVSCHAHATDAVGGQRCLMAGDLAFYTPCRRTSLCAGAWCGCTQSSRWDPRSRHSRHSRHHRHTYKALRSDNHAMIGWCGNAAACCILPTSLHSHFH